MNIRQKKKRYDKYLNKNITLSFDDVEFVGRTFEALAGYPADDKDPFFRMFALDKDVLRAVKRYARHHVWKHDRCTNIQNMYSMMCLDIHIDKVYRKQIEEMRRSIINE